MSRLRRTATWFAVYAVLVAGGVTVGREAALHGNAARSASGVMVLAASSNGNGSGHPPFGISSVPVSGLVPGGTARALSITLTNSDSTAYKVTSLGVASSNPNGCTGSTSLVIAGLGSANLLTTPYDASATGAPQLEIPKKGTLALSGVTIRLLDLASRQDACKGVTFALTYSGTAVQGSGAK